MAAESVEKIPAGDHRPTIDLYNDMVDGRVNEDAAWYYPEPSAMAARIKDHVAFWHGVKVED